MVTLEDHSLPRHVTGSPPHNQVLNLVGALLYYKALNVHLRELWKVDRLCLTVWGKQTFGLLSRGGGRCWGS